MQKGGIKYNPKKKKIFDPKRPIISIITVVFNSESLIENTIKSIINQSYYNIEYIVIDGDSTDNTLSIIQKYDEFIDLWISEADSGLYDAMNKGLKQATGDYVWFINSGDLIYSNAILSQIFGTKKQLADIYYGETKIIDSNGKTIGMRRHKAPKQLTANSFKKGMQVSHQSIIIKKKLTKQYNTAYKYSSDFDWVLSALTKTDKIKNTKLILSKFLDGGQTSRTMLPGLKERFKIMIHYFGFLSTIYEHFLMLFKLTFYYIKNKRI